MVTVLRDGPYFISGGIELIGDNTQKEHQKNIIPSADVEPPITNLFVMECIFELILGIK
jgi:hypothetical protein